MVLLWKRLCALCGTAPLGQEDTFADLRNSEELFDIARAFKVQAKRKCPTCAECWVKLIEIQEFSKKCQKTQAFISICGLQKLHKEEDVLKLREEFLSTGDLISLEVHKKEEISVLQVELESPPDIEVIEEPAIVDEAIYVTEGNGEDDSVEPEEVEGNEDLETAEDSEFMPEEEGEGEEYIQSIEEINEEERDEDTKPKIKKEFQKTVKSRSRRNVSKSRTFKHNFKCSQCDLILHSRHHLELHEKKHTPKSPVKLSHICEGCGKGFAAASTLRAHAVMHTDERPFPCEKCGMAFKNAYGLKCHMETHDDRKYICPVCGMKLSTSHTYHSHLKIHSDKRNYKCPVCPKAFKRHTPLKEHLFGHADLRPYRCPFCLKTFVNGSSCRLHKVRLHPQELKELEASGGMDEVLEKNRNLPSLQEIKAIIMAKFGKVVEDDHEGNEEKNSD